MINALKVFILFFVCPKSNLSFRICFACKTYLKTETGFGAVALIAPQGKECFSFLVRSFFFRRYEKERMNKNKTLF